MPGISFFEFVIALSVLSATELYAAFYTFYSYLRKTRNIALQCFITVNIMKALIILLFVCAPVAGMARGAASGSPILGQWITDKKDLIVEVFLKGTQYGARIVWAADNSAAPEKRLDEKNPDPALRNRKVFGMEVLDGLTYNETDHCWENGHIYDATSGKTWRASARLEASEQLVVRGYWGFEIFGKTLRFTRYK
jgi:uncharacterized protein (DUF2147 family)